MGMRLDEAGAVMDGRIEVEAAEQILEWAQGKKAPTVDLGGLVHLHPACLQVLMAAGAVATSWPTDEGLKMWLMSALASQEPKQ
jgi:hypothetical protein